MDVVHIGARQAGRKRHSNGEENAYDASQAVRPQPREPYLVDAALNLVDAALTHIAFSHAV